VVPVEHDVDAHLLGLDRSSPDLVVLPVLRLQLDGDPYWSGQRSSIGCDVWQL
jgi:hypothetical protein